MADKPTTEGGVWGSYVDYLSTLESELKAAQATVQTLTSVIEQAEQHVEERDQRVNELAADLLETRAQRAHLATEVARLNATIVRLTDDLTALRTPTTGGATVEGSITVRVNQPCERTDLPESADMHCPCGFEAGEHPAWIRRYCRNRRYPEHGRLSPCAICGYVAP